MNLSQRDVECQAIPRQINKYVGCKPNVKNKETMIEKGALFDENEERLRICKAELETTRRQVTVLQQKLVSVIQQQSSQKIKKRIAVVEDPNKNTVNSDDLEIKLKETELRNIELMDRVCSLLALVQLFELPDQFFGSRTICCQFNGEKPYPKACQ